MTDVVAVHGAFRGGWYWQPLADELAASGHRLSAVHLTGTGERSMPRPDDVGMDDWVDDVVAVVASISTDDTVLLGHSMGGVVAQAAAARLGDRIRGVVLLDSPLIVAGQRAVDVSGPAPPPPDQLPPRSSWIEPTPVGPEQGFDDLELADWVNTRLSGVPMGPQLDPVRATSTVSTSLVFFARTPEGFPSTFERRRCEQAGREHLLLDEHHDAPVLAPARVGVALTSLLEP